MVRYIQIITVSVRLRAIANYDINFINDLTGFAVGVYAKMFNSTDGGISWNQVTEPMVASMFDMGYQFIYNKWWEDWLPVNRYWDRVYK